MTEIRGLSIQQPDASRLITGSVTVVNWQYDTDYRGQVLIHAPRRFRPGGKDLPRGVVLGTAQLVSTHQASGGTYVHEGIGMTGLCCERRTGALSPDSYATLDHGKIPEKLFHWMFEDPRPLDAPVISGGAPGLWVPQPKVYQEVFQEFRRMAGLPARPVTR